MTNKIQNEKIPDFAAGNLGWRQVVATFVGPPLNVGLLSTDDPSVLEVQVFTIQYMVCMQFANLFAKHDRKSRE